MQTGLELVYQKRLEKTKEALEKNRMEVYLLDNAEQVVPLVKTLIPEGATVTNGGSVTLEQTGVMELLRQGSYRFLDREAPGADREQIYREAFSAEAYLASANAITRQGEIFQMDGNANRVAAIAYGPASVILVVGRNKIVADIESARRRNKEISAPANNIRLGNNTACAATGICVDCNSPSRICCTEMVLRQQRIPGRIKVILVNQDLGY